MATSTNYGWAEPDNSSLVKNGASDMRTLGNAIDVSLWNSGFGQAGKNKIINGKFDIWQRGTSFSNPSNGTYCADRFKTINDGTGATRTISQQAFTAGTAPVAGYEAQYFMRYAVSAAGTGNTYQGMNHYIEDVRTLAGQAITVSFWAKADASRTVNVDLSQNFGSGGSSSVYVTLSAASASVTTSWQRFTFTGTVPSIAGKTIGTGSALVFGYYAPAATVCTIDIWGVQVEAGSTATPFQTATGTIQGELAACQRYYVRTTSSASYPYAVFAPSGITTSTTSAIGWITFPVEMRTLSSVVEYGGNLVVNNGVTSAAVTSVTFSDRTTTKIASLNFGVASGLIANQFTTVHANNSSTAYIGVSAEL